MELRRKHAMDQQAKKIADAAAGIVVEEGKKDSGDEADEQE